MTDVRRIAITGASGGIGRALAVHYAAPGVVLYLAGRRETALAETATRCRARGAAVEIAAFDVRRDDAFTRWVDEVTGAPELEVLFFAAGVSASVASEGDRPRPESDWDLERELEVNAVSVIRAANRAADNLAAVEGPHVQIGLMASLAALTGLPSSPGYSASKAAVATYGEALRRLMAETRVGVTVVFPGYVTSAMSQRYQGAKPWEISAAAAAKKIARGLAKNQARVVFPRLLAWGIWWLSLLPEGLQKVFLKGFRFTVTPDEESVGHQATEALFK